MQINLFVELTVRRHCFHPSKGSVEKNEEAEDLIQLTHIIVDCSSFPYIDLMGVDALARAHAEYKAINITVFFACCKGYSFFFFYNRNWKKKNTIFEVIENPQ